MKQDVKTVTMNILNGLSVGIIVALVPGAILNALVKLLLPSFPQLAVVTYMTTAAMTLLPALSAVCVGMLAKFTPIQTSSLALAAIIGAGNYHLTKTSLSVAGTGDVINLAITLAIGYLVILLLGNALKAYTILLIPSLVLLIAGGVGMLTLKPVSGITKYIGVVVHDITELQPIAMGVLMGIIFAILIVTPISTVGPLAALDAMKAVTVGNVLELTVIFFILPIGLAYLSNLLFTKTLHYQVSEDYALHYD
ncbi:PTS sugar transporter subunit IIC [Lacticaseibacillus rhamnosus]|uniref:PTS sugar transporter subunit IIC n=1 Tax=Lacticaseibacillus rhamnosus TaxID=47715 RepID=UPI0007E06D6A|nr:PTS sugar transporter subunit IIC [Lacticaseibacillus rhamnosus]OAU14494.1 hypothetical protein PY76_07640 [Lacticaseibacillus rhamnosus]OAU20908.1 hypothetical protein PY77_06500 [Lacticaseibacillus rhamnosus]OAU36102.1 hypothetical protein PY78_00140 [Lacticaseibacillus rhamnosus]